MRNCLKELDQVRKERGKEQELPEPSIIREKPNQMMLSNPLESFLKDLGNQEQQSDPAIPNDQALFVTPLDGPRSDLGRHSLLTIYFPNNMSL